MRITLVAATRPNFMKIAPLIRAIDKRNAGISGLNLNLNLNYEDYTAHTGCRLQIIEVMAVSGYN